MASYNYCCSNFLGLTSGMGDFNYGEGLFPLFGQMSEAQLKAGPWASPGNIPWGGGAVLGVGRPSRKEKL